MKDKQSVWHDIVDPRRAAFVDDLEAGLKEPEFENLEIPEKFGPVQEIVDDHKIKRYAFEIDEYGPWFLDKSPFYDGARIGQAGILVNDMVQLFTQAYRPSHVIGLHTEEQIWFDSPVKLDEVVTLQGEYTESYVRRGQGYVVMHAQTTGEDGRSIVRHRGVEILKTIPGDIAARASATPEKRVTGELQPGARFVSQAVADLKPGDAITPIQKNITAEQAAVYSRVGDFIINIHNNLDMARKGNMPIPIVQGAQLFCTLTQMLTQFFGPAFFTGGWLRTKFIAPVPVFEAFELSGQVIGVEKLPDGKRKVDLEVWVRRSSDSRLAVAGWASATVE
jgi:acyl dehydratase